MFQSGSERQNRNLLEVGARQLREFLVQILHLVGVARVVCAVAFGIILALVFGRAQVFVEVGAVGLGEFSGVALVAAFARNGAGLLVLAHRLIGFILVVAVFIVAVFRT